MVVNFIGWWIFCGACIWVLLDASGVTEEFRKDRAKRGLLITWPGLTLATLAAIVLWPAFAWALARKVVKGLRA